MPRPSPRRSAATLCFAVVALTLVLEAGADPLPDSNPVAGPASGPTPFSIADDASSIWDGVFTAAQAERGRAAYVGTCDRCHGRKLDGAPDDPDMLPTPPAAGAKFLRKWHGRTLAALFDYTRTTMPANNPGFLTDQEVVDLIAYVLSVSRAPAGDTELAVDVRRLARVRILEHP